MFKYINYLLILLLVSACTTSSKDYARKVAEQTNLAEIRHTDPDGFISYLNVFYGFTFKLPKSFNPKIDDVKNGGYNFKEEEKGFMLSTHGFSPFTVTDLKTASHTLWSEIVPKGFNFQKEGSIPLKGFQSYAVEGLVEDGKKYQYILIILDEVRSRNFVVILQSPTNQSSKEIGLEILKSIQKVNIN